ncbi:alpha/beta hydrolase [Paractinoplanes lichenicola]|uniref:Alpha/beta hydrolase n=1 Tax=Paractinoplanes lichenicola TaxID=2802976 RepID=A0ABS1VW64_9ACTN|nr:alpha/beta hydrolase [Actinoplanes lichenicola]MBL7258727.1 alpha/beta hydrolase [Actinoplanes lichenicola]
MTHAYRTVPGFRPLLLDLHDSAPGAPLIVFVHGGAFLGGSRATLPAVLDGLFQLLPAAGFAVASIDYRLSGEEVWPGCVEDVEAAVRWLLARTPNARIVLWGESAGGYLAVTAGLRLSAQGFPVRAMVDWYGPVDFLTMAEQGAPWTDDADSPESRLLGAPVQTVPALARLTNPCRLVTLSSPPLLVMHGTADELIPYSQSVQLAAAYEKAGAACTVHPVDKAGHGFTGRSQREVLDPVLDFLHSVLRRHAG